MTTDQQSPPSRQTGSPVPGTADTAHVDVDPLAAGSSDLEQLDAIAATGPRESASVRVHGALDGDAAINVLDHLPFGVLCRDVEGRILCFNRMLTVTFPILTPAAIGLTLAELVPHTRGLRNFHDEAMSTGEIVNRTALAGQYAGERANLTRTVVPLRNSGGDLWGSVTIVEDRTEYQALEHDTARTQKLESLGQLAAGFAHEINTPMQYIGDNTRFLRNTICRLLNVIQAAERATRSDATPADLRHLRETLTTSDFKMLAERSTRAADDALAGVEDVSQIVTAMKRFSHPGSIDMKPVDLNESIATTLTVCRSEWRYAANVVTDFGNIPPIDGHHGELNQVWLNLIVNAAHAITERHPDTRGDITITTEHHPQQHMVSVTIADNGVGISKEHIDRILDPFFTTKEVGKGTGQGLTIAHRVITQDHGGTLTVDSVENEGATFTITLPVSQPPRTEA